jgi:broad specificity phosphatase PhoE
MKTVHLVRHGEVHNPNHVVYGDLPGFRLSDAGLREAKAVGDHLSLFRIDAVVSSPLERAVQTAVEIARHHALVVATAPGLGEARMYPEWTGHAWDDIPERFPGQLEQYLADATVSTGTHETIEEVAERTLKTVTDALERGSDDLAIVSHQDPIQAFRLVATARDLSELRLDPPAHCEVITLEGGPDTWTETARWKPEQVHG